MPRNQTGNRVDIFVPRIEIDDARAEHHFLPEDEPYRSAPA